MSSSLSRTSAAVASRVAEAGSPLEAQALAALESAFARFERIAISFSGAEDMVLIDLAARVLGSRSVPAFSLDTGRLHSQTYRFLETVRDHYAVDLELLAPDATELQALVRENGLFSFYRDGHGECCAVRKIQPLRRKLAQLDAWVTGQRSDQKRHARGLADRGAGSELLHGRPSRRQVQSVGELAQGEDVWEYPPPRSPLTRCTMKASAPSAASPARARSARTSTSAKAAGGGKVPRTRSAACTPRTPRLFASSAVRRSRLDPCCSQPRNAHYVRQEDPRGRYPVPEVRRRGAAVRRLRADGANRPCGSRGRKRSELRRNGLAAEHDVAVAPFFVVEEGEATTVYTVYLRFAKEVLGGRANVLDESKEMLRANPDLDLI